MKSIISLLFAALFMQALPVGAQPTFAIIKEDRAAQYIVSGMLRSNADGMVIKLVHGVEVAGSPDEAIGQFSREALDKYPGYALINTLATPIPARKSECGISI
jgi:hypothetical protein